MPRQLRTKIKKVGLLKGVTVDSKNKCRLKNLYHHINLRIRHRILFIKIFQALHLLLKRLGEINPFNAQSVHKTPHKIKKYHKKIQEKSLSAIVFSS